MIDSKIPILRSRKLSVIFSVFCSVIKNISIRITFFCQKVAAWVAWKQFLPKYPIIKQIHRCPCRVYSRNSMPF